MERTRVSKRAAASWAVGMLATGLVLALLVLALAAGASLRTSAEQSVALCVTPHPMVHHIVLPGLCKGVGGISSYVVTNPTEGPAVTLHAYCTNEHNLVLEQPDPAPIEPYDLRVYHLAKMTDLPPGYRGYVVVQSDRAITGTVLPPPFTVFLPAEMRTG